MHRPSLRLIVWVLAIGSLIAVGATLAAAEGASRYTVIVQTHPSQGPVQTVDGASASLTTNDNGATLTLQTVGLVPGSAYTLWFVAINNPAACATTPCTGTDVLTNPSGVQSEVAYLTGHVVGADGRATLSGHMSAGVVPGGWFGNGYTNVRGAEIHLVLHDHGPAIPDLVSNQISTLRGGCTDESVPAAFPPVAHADGIPGPNTCRLMQFAIFQQ